MARRRIVVDPPQHIGRVFDAEDALGLNALNNRVSAESFGSGPYSGIDGIHTSALVGEFERHIEMEKNCIVNVPIADVWPAYDSKTQSVEEFLRQCGWEDTIREHISSVLDVKDLDNCDLRFTAKNQSLMLLRCLDREKLVAVVFNTAVGLCSFANNYTMYNDVCFIRGRQLIELISVKLLQNDGLLLQDNFLGTVLEKYSAYFVDSNIARSYTHREWWIKCTADLPGAPKFGRPFVSNVNSPTLAALAGTFVIDALLQLKFEVATKRQKSKGDVHESLNTTYPVFFVDKKRSCFVQRVGSKRNRDKAAASGVTDFENAVNVLGVDQRFVTKLRDRRFEYVAFSVRDVPMTVPPRPWLDDLTSGGLYTQSHSSAIRPSVEYERYTGHTVAQLCHQRLMRTGDLSKVCRVADALNELGCTPWLVNGPVLDVVLKMFKRAAEVTDPADRSFYEKLDIPCTSKAIHVPPFQKTLSPEDMEDDDKRAALFASRRQRISSYEYSCTRQLSGVRLQPELALPTPSLRFLATKERSELSSLWWSTLYRLVLANHYRDKPLFFPHSLDFRGRAYPVAPHFNHMGDDITRGILKFAKGKPLGKDGFDWLQIHCINLTGTMKRCSISDRLKRALELREEILDSADRPIKGRRWWMDSDEPWETLAACMEIRNALRSGDPCSFVSHLPCQQDGSCNGLQHYAALGRDEQGAAEVNLVPLELPQDVYSSVLNRVEEKRAEDEKLAGTAGADGWSEIARQLNQCIPIGRLGRKVIKQTVMTTVYGVTPYGARLQIVRQLRALNLDGVDDALLRKFAHYLAMRTLMSLHDAFSSSMRLKDSLRSAASLVSGNGSRNLVQWTTPLGLPVIQPYLSSEKFLWKGSKGKNAMKKSGEETETGNKYGYTTRVVVPRKMKQTNSFPPNYIHSLDSSHMMLTALYCQRQGLTFASVHDCYWTHACAVDEMNKICREQFVNLHSIDLVKKLEKELQSQSNTDISLPNCSGSLDIKQVLKSVYFFS